MGKPRPASDSTALVFGAWIMTSFHGGVLSGPAHVQGDNGKTLCNRQINIWWQTDILEAGQIGCQCCRRRIKAEGQR